MATGDPIGPTYSVSVRLQRITTEFAFVSVPVSDDLVIQQPDGSGRLNAAKLMERALQLGQAPEVMWRLEDRQVQLHPVQTPPDMDSSSV
jgi:hypothetical protein